jgi:hypothetical protein
MPLNHAFDAKNPPSKPPEHCDAVFGYIGGKDSARIWTHDEWLRFEHLRQFPIWVPDYTLSPVAQARAAANTAHSMNWHDGRAIITDSETEANPGWYNAFATQLRDEHFIAVDYGSLSTVLGNAASYVIVAAWDGVADIAPGQTIEGEQYAADVAFDGTQIDLSVISDELLHHGGIGPRH